MSPRKARRPARGVRTARAVRAFATAIAIAAGAVFAFALGGCDDDPTVPNLEYMPDMVSSEAFDSFAPNPNTADGRTLMAPPPGTVPRGYQPLHFAPGPAEALRAGRELTNPLPDGPLVRLRGEVAFARWCSPCHGREGQADGLVARRFPRPPSLTAEHARGLPDGQLFHILTFGQGVMPAYGQQIVAEDRWKLVRFLRQLQSGPVKVAVRLSPAVGGVALPNAPGAVGSGTRSPPPAPLPAAVPPTAGHAPGVAPGAAVVPAATPAVGATVVPGAAAAAVVPAAAPAVVPAAAPAVVPAAVAAPAARTVPQSGDRK